MVKIPLLSVWLSFYWSNTLPPLFKEKEKKNILDKLPALLHEIAPTLFFPLKQSKAKWLLDLFLFKSQKEMKKLSLTFRLVIFQ